VPPDVSNEVALSQVLPLPPNRLSVGELELAVLPLLLLSLFASAKAPISNTTMSVDPEFLAMVLAPRQLDQFSTPDRPSSPT
jgi:hypothetical protein